MSGVSVIGNGAWGTALAGLAAEKSAANSAVTLWGRTEKPSPYNTQDLSEACKNRIFIMALPAAALGERCQDMRNHLPDSAIFISAAKGMVKQGDRLWLPSEILVEAFPNSKIAVLAGPNFAAEVAAGLPAASVVAGDDAACTAAMDILASKHFRLYRNASIVAVELCAVMKNIIAIACGIAQGLQLGDNAKAALMTRGLAEMHRLTAKICGDEVAAYETISGLAGIGDLALTCNSLQSRNMAFGYALGQGSDMRAAENSSKGVCEGVKATPAIVALGQKHQVELPIINCVNDILYSGQSIAQAISELLNRPLNR